MAKDHLVSERGTAREENHCPHYMANSFPLVARDILCTPSYRPVMEHWLKGEIDQ